MRKPKIAICLLALAMALWAARPVALANGGDWLTLGDIPEAGETTPEPGERSSEQSFPSWLGDSNEDPAAADEPEEENEGWLTTEEAQAVAEDPEPEPEEESDWLTPDEAPSSKEAPTPEDPEETEKTALDSGALIEVTVPANGEMVINPQRFPVTLGGKVIRDQIINVPQLLTNRSDAPIIVTASVMVNTEESGGLTVTDRPIGEGETEKLAYLYVEFQNVADSEKEAVWSGGYTGASNQLLVSGSGTVSGDVLRVEAGDTIPTYASYRLFGSLTENPATGWQAGDKLSVTVSFTFRPAEEAEPEEEAETVEESEEADAEPVETAQEPEEIPEMKDKADAKPEEVPVIAVEPDPEPDPGPDPEPETLETPAYEPAAVFEREEEQEEKGIEFLASAMNADWMAPPDER